MQKNAYKKQEKYLRNKLGIHQCKECFLLNGRWWGWNSDLAACHHAQMQSSVTFVLHFHIWRFSDKIQQPLDKVPPNSCISFHLPRRQNLSTVKVPTKSFCSPCPLLRTFWDSKTRKGSACGESGPSPCAASVCTLVAGHLFGFISLILDSIWLWVHSQCLLCSATLSQQ